MTRENKKRKKQSLKKLEKELISYELGLYEEAFRLDRKRRTTYIQ